MIRTRIKGNLLQEAATAMKVAAALKRIECIKALRETTPVDTGEARDGWYIDEKGNLVNEVDHISKLNDGHSKQAPAFFIEQTLLTRKGVRPSGTIVRSL
jgi:hypothetical protein